jgi:hypothetical protein
MKEPPIVMWRHVVWQKFTDISQEHTVSIFKTESKEDKERKIASSAYTKYINWTVIYCRPVTVAGR